MSIDRRGVLKGLLGLGCATMAGPKRLSASLDDTLRADGYAMLYDATRCIGCKTCVAACRRANNLPLEDPSSLWDAPSDLSDRTKNVIKYYSEESSSSFMKAQCMHCLEPACASVCMIGALHKTERGIVAYDPSRCIGCRYCQVACAFNIPKFEWDKPLPKIVKCEMCRHLLEKGGQPACCEICPVEAVDFGLREELLADAHDRLAKYPKSYHQKVYGERDGGGTGVLYLSAVPFEKLGLPDLGDKPVPHLSITLQRALYKGFIAPVALYAFLGAVMWRNRNNKPKSESFNGTDRIDANDPFGPREVK